MALLFSLAFTTFLLLLSLFWLLKVWRRIKPQNKVQKLPPGPRKLPLIGNLHNLIGSLPHHALQQLAGDHGPLMHLQLGEISAIVVSSPRLAKEFMKTHDLAFAERPELLAPKIISYGGSDIAFSPYGDYWRQMRKVCMLELLSAKRVQSFSSIREEEISSLIESIHSSAGSPINFTENICSLTSTVVCRAAFGTKCKDQDEFTWLVMESAALAGGFDIADLFPSKKFLHVVSGLKFKLEKIHGKIDKILDKIIHDHRENPMSAETGNGELWKEDLVDVFLRLQQSGSLEFPITTNNIKAVILVCIPSINTAHSKVINSKLLGPIHFYCYPYIFLLLRITYESFQFISRTCLLLELILHQP